VNNFDDFVEIFKLKEPLIYSLLRNNIVLDNYQPNKISLIEKIKLPNNFAQLITDKTKEILGSFWAIKILPNIDTKLDSIEEQECKDNTQKILKFSASTEFQEIKNIFPEVEVVNVEKIKH